MIVTISIWGLEQPLPGSAEGEGYSTGNLLETLSYASAIGACWRTSLSHEDSTLFRSQNRFECLHFRRQAILSKVPEPCLRPEDQSCGSHSKRNPGFGDRSFTCLHTSHALPYISLATKSDPWYPCSDMLTCWPLIVTRHHVIKLLPIRLPVGKKVGGAMRAPAP